ncbi:MAG: hypothetical protein ACQXXJ_05840 [Candidatus Bathyarchaeia archaeon]|jgi:hypothetical protein
MLPDGLAQMLPMLLMALAIGYGTPALLYLIFQGRNSQQQATAKKPTPEPAPPIHHTAIHLRLDMGLSRFTLAHGAQDTA